MDVKLQGALTCRSSTITVWADSGPFLGLLLYFGVSESFPRLTNPRMCLLVGHQHSHIRPILVCFVHYYSTFWGPRAISIIDEPRGVFMCLSSTLIVLANSDLFRGLLLTVLRSRSNFHSCRTPRRAYVLVINTPSFGRFWPVSWTITHRFGVPKRFPWMSNSKVRLRVGDQQSQFGPILARFLDYYSILGSRSHFDD